jgi:hypothetical protein
MKDKPNYKEEDFELLKLPALGKFRGTKKHGGPWERLQAWFLEHYSKEDATKMYRNLHIRDEELKVFRKMTKDWAKREHPFYREKTLRGAIGWYELDLAPIYFHSNPKWSKKGFAYIKKGWQDEKLEVYNDDVT